MRASNFRPNVKKPTTWAKRGVRTPWTPPPPGPPMQTVMYECVDVTNTKMYGCILMSDFIHWDRCGCVCGGGSYLCIVVHVYVRRTPVSQALMFFMSWRQQSRDSLSGSRGRRPLPDESGITLAPGEDTGLIICLVTRLPGYR